MRKWLFAVVIAAPCALSAQVSQVPDGQCLYQLGDNPAWAAANVDPSGWKPYTEYRMTDDAWVLWVRCRIAFDARGMQSPAVGAGADGPERMTVFVDGQAVNATGAYWIFPVAQDTAQASHTVALRIVQRYLAPGLTPGRPVRLFFGDAPVLRAFAEAERGRGLLEAVPTYTSFLLIGASGLFLLGLFLFDRSQKAAFWLGLYCVSVCLTRLNFMGHFVFYENYSDLIEDTFFGLAMFESWALVRVNFALAQRRVPSVYWMVFAAWVFMFVGSVLPVFLPAWLALPLSLFVQATCFKPIWCIWGFACTAPFAAFWPWNRLRGRMNIVAGLCAVWAGIEGWFQLQQVIFNRNTWSNRVQDWMSLAIAALVFAIFGYIFHEQRIAADERAEMRGELTAARQVQHLLIPDKTAVAAGVTVNAAFLPAHDVGGDFYLCRALPNGAQRVILGDVSGKGVAAALTSALLLGAADRCDDLRPPAVLKELNAALQNSGIDGFTTCLCADLLPGGVLLAANAGQLSPYRNGREIEIPPGLPLGVDAAPEYKEFSLQLTPGDTLTLVSDGVVEARSPGGELFGFERMREISSRSAQQIAEAAVAFGQQDDITVLTLSLASNAAAA